MAENNPVQGGNASLGNIASIASIPTNSQQLRLERFEMQSAAGKLLPSERVSQCLKHLAPGKKEVHVIYAPDKARARYMNLQICGSVWHCPICASRISERRRQELEWAVNVGSIYVPVMITYTLRHKAGSKLAWVLHQLLRAYDLNKSGMHWQRFKAEVGWIGSVRALEITHGKNGWHPHIHELAFLDMELDKLDFGALRERLAARWALKVESAGGNSNLSNGLDFKRSFKDIDEYIAKYGYAPHKDTWDLTEELTKSNTKRARKGGKTPFALLWDYCQGDQHAGRLFIEYANVVKGRNQLIWSRGLRETLGLDELDDEEALAFEEMTETDRVMLRLDPDAWREIRRKGLRGALLKACETNDVEILREFLENAGLKVYNDGECPTLAGK